MNLIKRHLIYYCKNPFSVCSSILLIPRDRFIYNYCSRKLSGTFVWPRQKLSRNLSFINNLTLLQVHLRHTSKCLGQHSGYSSRSRDDKRSIRLKSRSRSLLTNGSLTLEKMSKQDPDLDLDPANKQSTTFVSRPNLVTGKMDWVAQEENYDYIQEIARSGYGDMLHDEDRNKKYFAAIRKVVKVLKDQGKEVKVLDIGTGTGLLSMMAATAGADGISACEAFLPMAKCAKRVIEANKFSSSIKLIPKRSTDVLMGTDIAERANLLVTELFDTELIGEGAIGAYTDAHNRLMQEECLAVPSVGIVYVQPVQCSLLKNWNTLQPLKLPNGTAINIPSSFHLCGGAPSLHDIQVDELEDQLKFLSDPVEVFRFDFSKRNALKSFESNTKEILAIEDGDVDAFVMWWDLEMDPEGEITLSCAPRWTRPEPIPWRDHWMQALYYPSSPKTVRKGDRFKIHSCHDEYSLWFDTTEKNSSRPVCSCGLHVTFSRSRLGQMNDERRNSVFIQALQKHVSPSTICLVISDGSLLPLMAASLGAKKIFVLDTTSCCRKIMKRLLESNGLQDRVTVLEKDAEDILAEDLSDLKIDLVIAEPYFQAAHLPWEHLYFWYCLTTLKKHLSSDVVILPQSMTVHAKALEFRDLHKIRAPIGFCEGFDITAFDKLIENSSDLTDEEIEPQPLWEYPSVALSQNASLINVDFTKPVEDFPSQQQKTNLICTKDGCMNGVAFWTDFDFGDGLTISSGPDGSDNRWDLFTRQGVRLLRIGKDVKPGDTIEVMSMFDAAEGEFSFSVT